MTELEIATLAGGCFWCLEAVYLDLQGVEKVVSGYTGGQTQNPTYREVISGKTGHAEVVQVSFNPQIVTYKELIEIFFFIHDPTTLNKQGNDVGSQYRSAIYYNSIDQKNISEKFVIFLTGENVFPKPIVTEITQLDAFFEAEEYHQNYYANNSNEGYCRVVITPKVIKFRKKYLNKLKFKT